jgi:hypothetical protein
MLSQHIVLTRAFVCRLSLALLVFQLTTLSLQSVRRPRGIRDHLSNRSIGVMNMLENLSEPCMNAMLTVSDGILFFISCVHK